MSAYNGQFLPPDKVTAEALGQALHKGLTVGVPDTSVGEIRKAQRTPYDLQKLHGGPRVIERTKCKSVAAIRKIHDGGARPETGDTMRKLSLPGQSSNSQYVDDSPARAGAVGGVADVNDQLGGASAPRMGPASTASVTVGTPPPQDADAQWKAAYRKACANPKPFSPR
jgi:hypothetical protein